jgi:hypothetical protein
MHTLGGDIIFIGDIESPPDPRIEELGFTIANKCTLLGFTISQTEQNYDSNFSTLAAKTKKNINVCSVLWPFGITPQTS